MITIAFTVDEILVLTAFPKARTFNAGYFLEQGLPPLNQNTILDFVVAMDNFTGKNAEEVGRQAQRSPNPPYLSMCDLVGKEETQGAKVIALGTNH
jgi:hypothetical protein